MEYVIAWLICGYISYVIAVNKKLSGCAGFFWGAILGPLGIILVLVWPKDVKAEETAAIESGEMKKCPYCAELIKKEAIKCRYCGADLLDDEKKCSPK